MLLPKMFHSIQNPSEDDRQAVPDAGLDFTAEIAIVMLLPIFTDHRMDMSTQTDLHNVQCTWIFQRILTSA